MVVTIDGPAGSGKSTTARLAAKRLDWLYLDTGAMYRALTVKVLDEEIPLENSSRIAQLSETTQIELVPSENGVNVLLDGKDITKRIRHPDVDRAVGPVCEIPKVREMMVASQRRMANKVNVIAEGRDMGTVVFPDAQLKFYLVASLEERARRRQCDMIHQDIDVTLDEMKNEIERRDQRDCSRKISPLKKAKDAILLDTTGLTIDDQVVFIIRRIDDERSKADSSNEPILHEGACL